VPAPPLRNSFEGGSDATVITPANSGGASGDAFQTVSGTTWQFRSDRAKFGSFSMKAVNPPNDVFVEWTGLGTITSTLYMRYYAWLEAVPTVNHLMTIFLVTTAITNSAYTLAFGMDQRLYDGALSGGIGPYSIGQWIRVEAAILPSTTVGTSEWRLYNNPDADVNSYTARNVRTGLNTGTDIDRIRIGAHNVPITVGISIDLVEISTVDWLGPFKTPSWYGVPATPFW
jgi:hypothetical protein